MNVQVIDPREVSERIFLASFRDLKFRSLAGAVRNAERCQDTSDEMEEGLTYYVLDYTFELDGDYHVVRDWHESDFGRYQQVVLG